MTNTRIANAIAAAIVGAGTGAILVTLVSCTAAELKETGGNAGDAAIDTVAKVLADPTLVATPAGIAVLVSTFIAGFFGRQTVSVTKWAGSKTAGPLMRLAGKLFKKPAP